MRDEALPLFAAVDDKENVLRSEAIEPAVTLAPMTMGREVVEDYRSTGLSLRAHPPSGIAIGFRSGKARRGRRRATQESWQLCDIGAARGPGLTFVATHTRARGVAALLAARDRRRC